MMLVIHSIIPYTVIGREICLIPSEWRIAIIYIFIKHCIGSLIIPNSFTQTGKYTSDILYSAKHISGLLFEDKVS